MVEKEADEDDMCCELDGHYDKCDDYGDGQTYVIRKLMLTPEQKTKWCQLFQMKCRVHIYLFDVIINI